MRQHKLTPSIFTATVFVFAVTVGPALGQEWTPHKSQRLEQPEPYSPDVDQH